jgi:hypothetical protein
MFGFLRRLPGAVAGARDVRPSQGEQQFKEQVKAELWFKVCTSPQVPVG